MKQTGYKRNKAAGQRFVRGVAWILIVMLLAGSINIQAFAREADNEIETVEAESVAESVSGGDAAGTEADKPQDDEQPEETEPAKEDKQQEEQSGSAGHDMHIADPDGYSPDADAADGNSPDESISANSISVNSISLNSLDLDMLAVNGPVTFAYNGYPYGQISEDRITLTTELSEGEATEVKWYRSAAADGSYTEISGATELTYSFTAATGSAYWYKCSVNGQETYPVQVVYASSSGGTGSLQVLGTGGGKSAWYISNGTMAYTCGTGSGFDIIGKYQTYWISTSYNGGWQTDSASKIVSTFNESDAHTVEVEAYLPSGQTRFSIDADVCLGNSTTSGSYSDSASLKAVIENEQVTQIQMVGAASVDDAKETDPAFVLKCISRPSSFYLSRWNSRQTYQYNTTSGTGIKKQETVNGTANVVTEVAGIDSGMAMSWTNVTDGKVKFAFNIGSVAEAGAQIKANAVVTSKTVMVTQEEGNIGDYEYNLRDKTTGELVSDTWKVPDTQTKQVSFDNLTPNHVYEIVYRKTTGTDKKEESAGDTTTAIDPLKPDSGTTGGGEEKPAVETTIGYNAIAFKNLETSYQYRLLDTAGNAVCNWKTPEQTEGSLTFAGLKPGTMYYLVAKTSGNTQTDRVPYTTNKVTLTYNANAENVDGLPQSQEFASGDAISDNIPVREGYDFLGWNPEAEKESTVARYERGQTVSDIEEPATLYACWKIKEFTVHANGDDVSFTVEQESGTVQYGRNCVLTIRPESGYILKSITATVNGTELSTQQIGYDSETGCYTITLQNVTSDQEIQISGEYTTEVAQAADAAKNDLSRLLAEQKEKLEKLTDLSEEEKADYLQKLEEAVSSAASAMDQITDPADTQKVTECREQAEANLAALLTTAKEDDLSNAKTAAKEEIAKRAEKAKEEIDKLTDLSVEEKTALKQEVDEKAQAAKAAVDAVTDPAEKEKVTETKDNNSNAIEETEKEAAGQDLSNAKEKAKEEIEEKAQAAKEEIDKLPDLSEKEKTALKQEVDEKAQAAKAAVDAVTDPAEKEKVTETKDNSSNAIEETEKEAAGQDLSNTKEKAKEEIEEKAQAAKEEIDKLPDLSVEEKTALKQEVDEKAEAAKAAVDAIIDPAEKGKVTAEKNNGSNVIEEAKQEAEGQDFSNAKEKAKDEIERKAQAAKEEIDKLPDLSEEEKTALKQEVDEKEEAAKAAVDAITDPAEKERVIEIKNNSSDAIKETEKEAAGQDLSHAKEKAKEEIEKKAQAAKEEIDKLPDLSVEEKTALKQEVDEKGEAAKTAVDAIIDPAEKERVTETKNNSSDAMDKTEKEAAGQDLSHAKEKAKKEIEEKARAAKEEIDKLPDLSVEEKTALKQEVDEKAEAAKTAVDAITDPAEKEKVTETKETGSSQIQDTTKAAGEKGAANAEEARKTEEAKKAEAERNALEKLTKKERLATAKKEAVSQMKQMAAEAKNKIDEMTDLSEEEKQEAKNKIDDKVKSIQKKINDVQNVSKISKITKLAKKNEKAVQAVQKQAMQKNNKKAEERREQYIADRQKYASLPNTAGSGFVLSAASDAIVRVSGNTPAADSTGRQSSISISDRAEAAAVQRSELTDDLQEDGLVDGTENNGSQTKAEGSLQEETGNNEQDKEEAALTEETKDSSQAIIDNNSQDTASDENTDLTAPDHTNCIWHWITLLFLIAGMILLFALKKSTLAAVFACSANVIWAIVSVVFGNCTADPVLAVVDILLLIAAMLIRHRLLQKEDT